MSQSVRQMLSERLGTGNRIMLAQTRDDADALLEVTVARSASGKPGTVKIHIELINPRGDVIWTKSGGNYQGSAADVSAKIARDLIAGVQKSDQE